MRCKFSPVWALFLLCFSALVFFYKVVFFNKSFLGSLIVAQGITGSPPSEADRTGIKDYPYLDAEAAAYILEPATLFDSATYRNFRLPLWNPYVALGTPHMADPQSAHLYPLMIPLFMHPSPAMWDFFFVLRILIAGVFMYWFCRLWNLSDASSLAGAFLSVYCGHSLLYVHHNLLNAEALAPLLLLFVERMLRNTSIGNAIALGAALGIAHLGGTPPEASFAVIFFATAYFGFRLLTTWSSPGIAASRVAHFALAGIVGGMLSLPVTAPFLEYLAHSYHTHHDTGLLQLQPVEFMLLFVPYFLGEHNFVLPYVGVIAPVLLLFAFSPGNGTKPIWFFGGFIVFYLAKSFGVYGTNWVGELPLFRQTYFPKYFHYAFVLSLAFCAAAGMDAIVKGKGAWWRRVFPFVPIPAYLMVFYWEHVNSIEQLAKTRMALAQFGVAVLSIALVALVSATCWKLKKKWLRLEWILCAFLFLELFRYALPLDYPRRADPFAPAPYLEFLKKDPSLFRIFSVQGVLPPNYSAVVGLSDIGFNSGIFIEQYIELMRNTVNPASGYGRSVNMGAPDIQSKFLDLFNVKYVIAKTYLPLNASRFPLVYDDEVKIYRNLNCMPRAFVVHHWEIIGVESQVLDRLLSQSFDFAHTAIIEEHPEHPMTSPAGDLDNMPSIHPEVVQYEPDEVVLKVDLARTGLLVFTDSFFPGWRASVDGKDSRILRADYLFRALSLPAGSHTIGFTYRPMSFWIPLAISMATLAGIALFFFWKIWKLARGMRVAQMLTHSDCHSERSEESLSIPK
jgi:hypothetical protein